MATNPLTRRALIDQIPTEEGRAAPAQRPTQGIHSTEVGRQVYNTAMALPGAGGLTKAASTGGMISRTLNTAAGAANKMAASGIGIVGATAAADELMPAGRQATANPLAAAASQQGDAGRGAINPPVAGAAQPVQQTNAGSLVNNVTKVVDANTGAVSYSGNDIKDGFNMNGKPSPHLMGGGQISAQNMAAADRLAGSNAIVQRAGIMEPASMGRLQQFKAPAVAHSGNDFAARKRLENLKTSASSITNTARWGGKNAHQNPSVLAYQEALKADLAAQGKVPDLEMDAQKLNADMQQEGMRQDGADRRDGRRSLIDAARLGMEQETQGFATRAAGQQEQLRNTLLDPNATPEQRAIAQRSLVVLSGKTAADRMQTVTLPDATNDMGQVVRGGQALVRTLDDGTVQQVPISPSVNTRQVPPAAIDALRKNPKAAAQFDEVFGQGASRQYLR